MDLDAFVPFFLVLRVLSWIENSKPITKFEEMKVDVFGNGKSVKASFGTVAVCGG